MLIHLPEYLQDDRKENIAKPNQYVLNISLQIIMEDLNKAELSSFDNKILKSNFRNLKMLICKIVLFVLVVFFDKVSSPDLIFMKCKIICYFYMLENVYLTSIIPILKKYSAMAKSNSSRTKMEALKIKNEISITQMCKKAMEKCFIVKIVNVDKLVELISTIKLEYYEDGEQNDYYCDPPVELDAELSILSWFISHLGLLEDQILKIEEKAKDGKNILDENQR